MMEEGEIEDGEIEDDSGDTTVVKNDEIDVTKRDSSSGLLGGKAKVTAFNEAGKVYRRDGKSGGLGLSRAATRKRPYHGSGFAKRSEKPVSRTGNYRSDKHYDNNINNCYRNYDNSKNKAKKRQHELEDDHGPGYWMDGNGSKFIEKKYNDNRKDGSRRETKPETSFKKSKKTIETSLSNFRERVAEGPSSYSGKSVLPKVGIHTNKKKDPEDFEQLLKEHRMVHEAIEREKEKIKQTEKELNDGEIDSQSLLKNITQEENNLNASQATGKLEMSSDVQPAKCRAKEKDENDDDEDILELRLAALTSLAQKNEKEEDKSKPKQDLFPRKSESLSNNSTKKRTNTPRRSSAISRSRKGRHSIRQSRLRPRSRSTSGPRARTTKDILEIDDEEERINQFLLYLRETPEARDMTCSTSTDKETTEAESSDMPGNESIPATMGVDNYEQVEMDIDELQESEEKVEILTTETGTDKPIELSQPPVPGTQPIPCAPPPLPPPPPMESDLPKPPEPEEEDDEEEMALRQLLLQNLKQKKMVKATEGTKESKASQGPSPVVTPRSESPSFQRPIKKKPSVIKIPVHKEVVINLNDSDSSDDENTSSRASSGYTNMLDQFLKEARKKADANKPGSFKETIPSLQPKTPEAMKQLSTTQQEEYKRLKEEIAKREKTRKIKGGMNQSPVQSDLDTQSQDENEKNIKRPTAGSATTEKKLEKKVDRKEDVRQGSKNLKNINKTDLEKKALEEKRALKQMKIKILEEKLVKFRLAIKKDVNLFEEADQKLEKKKSTLKLAMAKIKKLTEQLETVRKIASANENGIKKIHNDKTLLHSRLLQLKNRESQLLETLAGIKGVPLDTIISNYRALNNSRMNSSSVKKTSSGVQKTNESNKRQRLNSEKETILAKEKLELIKLQELEKMYAEKIAKYKESHKQLALKKRLIASPAVSKVLKEANISENIRPSKQLYLKDKITVPSASGMNGEENNDLKVPRRRSWLDEESSTMKPSLSAESSPKEPVVKNSEKMELDKSEIASIFNTEELEKLKKLQERREKVLRFCDWTSSIDASVSKKDSSDLSSGIKVDLVSQQSSVKELVRNTSIDTYESPLMPWNVFRLNPLFKRLASESQGSSTFCNKINPFAIFCRFELNGKCNDDDCRWQHERDFKMSFEETLAHLVSYNVSIVGATDKSTLQQIQRKVWLFAKMKVQDLKTDSEEEKQQMIEKTMNLVFSKPQRTSLRFEPRRWKVTQRNKKTLETDGELLTDEDVKIVSETKPISLVDPDFIEDDDLRYFQSDVGTGHLENSVLQKPDDIQLWLKLAYKQLSKPGNSNLDKALHALSRGLDNNKNDPDLWLHYLTLYNKRSDNHDDVMEMCNHGIQYTNDYKVWHKALSIANTIDDKDNLCQDLLQALQDEQESSPSEIGSHRLLEMLLYRCQLHCLVNKNDFTLEILRDCVYKTNEFLILEMLTSSDKCLVWLCYIHFKYFKHLPQSLFDSTESAPSRLVSKELFYSPWTKSSISVLDEIEKDFNDAIERCKELSDVDSVLTCMPLYENIVQMYIACDSPEKAVSTCRALVTEFPCCDQLWILLLKTLKSCDSPNFNQVVEEALSYNSRSPGIFLTAASYAIVKRNKDLSRSLLHRCATSYFTNADDHDAITLYCKLLNQSLPYIPHQLSYAEDVGDDLKQQKVHLWMCYALLHEINGSESATVEAYMVALYDLTNTKDVHKVWLGYLQYHLRKMSSSTDKTQHVQTWHDLIKRCLATSPCKFPVPFNTTRNWIDYSFHNKVVNLYMATIKDDDKLDVFERLLSMMPKNTLLLLRVCQYAVLAERPQQAFIHCTTFLRDQPHCIQAWKVAIHLRLITKNYKQVRHLYTRALSSNPLVVPLWINYLLFLVAHGSNPDINQAVCTSSKHGINLKELAINRILPTYN
ncbi:zinc finger C3H1 domain-containing protein-like [Antedon mediterranea]|uniref:zinc finger C3H1 domain-containing protein-like n=1 Tax=Antedon mediterranea TaxID=105859 RepID=UPI003AF881EF